jgi:hypothetical protein|nr:MAG TPA: hypothetical protein [Caudoviricetes sp.]
MQLAIIIAKNEIIKDLLGFFKVTNDSLGIFKVCIIITPLFRGYYTIIYKILQERSTKDGQVR